MNSSKTVLRASAALASAICLVTLAPARGEHLGTIGPVYAVAEESALDTILRTLREKDRRGELRRIEREAVTRSVNSIRSPAPVDGISTVRVRAQRLLDPTVSYASAITTEEGQVVVPAGARINPLLVTALSKRLVFFDGRDHEQTEAVRRLVNQQGNGIKPILVGGSWYALSKAWKTQVYYDQQGTLSRRFGVTAVPCVVSQRNEVLLLEEIPAKELR